MSASSSGRWWVVGASWVRADGTAKRSAEDSAAPGSGGSSISDSDGDGDDGRGSDHPAASSGARGSDAAVTADAKLYELARQQRMNTDARRNVFVALMGADGAEDAIDRLLKLGLKVGCCRFYHQGCPDAFHSVRCPPPPVCHVPCVWMCACG